MIVYNIKTKHFTLAYNEVEEGWFAIHSGTAKSFKIRLFVKNDELPSDVFVSISGISLENREELEKYVEVLEDASVFAELIKTNIHPI